MHLSYLFCLPIELVEHCSALQHPLSTPAKHHELHSLHYIAGIHMEGGEGKKKRNTKLHLILYLIPLKNFQGLVS